MKSLRPLRFAIPALISLLLAACSAQAWYAGLRQGGENQCRQAAPNDAEACIARLNNKPYDEYTKDRKGSPQ